MTNFGDNLQKESEQFRMTDSEKSAIRARLAAAMGAPARPISSPYVRFFAPRTLALLSLGLLVILSSGTAYAAEGSLPGGVLWPVKTAVIEPIAVALASTPAQKAEVNAEIAARRVAEAQTLAAQGALTAQTAKVISDNYTAHATAALALAHDADMNDTATSTDEKPVAVATTSASQEGNSEHAKVMTLAIHTAVSMEGTEPAATATPAVPASTHAASTTPENSKRGLSGKLNATLSAQTKLLQQIGVEVDMGDGDSRENRHRGED